MVKEQVSRTKKTEPRKSPREKAPALPPPELEPTEEQPPDNTPAQTEGPAPAQDQTQEQEAAPAEETAPEPKVPTEILQELVQILLKVPPETKERAQKQAGLAFQYGWIEQPTVKHLFVWVTDTFLDATIKNYIMTRKKAVAGESAAAGEAKPE